MGFLRPSFQAHRSQGCPRGLRAVQVVTGFLQQDRRLGVISGQALGPVAIEKGK